MSENTVPLSGLFPLALHSVGAPGAPELSLQLLVYTPGKIVTGHSLVTQAVNPPLHLVSHVRGSLINEYVMGPGSKVRIDLAGWPEIHWPPVGGIGPVIPENLQAMIILETDYSKGTVHYQYRTDWTGHWKHIEQPIKRV